MKDLKTMKFVFAVTVIALTFLSLPIQGHAITLYTDRPSWEAAQPSFADVDLASQVAEGVTLTAGSPIFLPFSEVLVFGADMTGLQVPTSWATWSGGQTPRVLYTGGSDGPITGFFITGPAEGFGLEMEPNFFSTFDMTLALSDGSIITQAVAGEGGAAFFGWVGGSVVSMSMTCGPGCGGFAIGRMVKSGPSVPEPASLLLLGSGLAGLGLWGRRKFKGI